MRSSRLANSARGALRCLVPRHGDVVARSKQREQEHLFHGPPPDHPQRHSNPDSSPRRSFPRVQKTAPTTARSHQSSRQTVPQEAGPITRLRVRLVMDHSENRPDRPKTGRELSPFDAQANLPSTSMRLAPIRFLRYRVARRVTSNVHVTQGTVVRLMPPKQKMTPGQSPAGPHLAIVTPKPERSTLQAGIHEQFRSDR